MTNTLPLIGIPCRHDISSNYPQNPINAQSEAYMSALAEAGGLPFLIPLNLETSALRRLYDLADGILLTGGGDITPSLFQQAPHPSLSDVQPDRDELEMTLSRWAVADGKPLLGICRGIQVMAIAAGGTLCQDLPSEMPEATLHYYGYLDDERIAYDKLIHEVELTSSCRLAHVLRTRQLWVNSLHHQAVRSVPEPVQIVGRSSDGVVEVIELPGHPFFIGLQWHPEVLVAEHESARQIFRAFVEACEA
jgi:putative glutamine amidotransferase